VARVPVVERVAVLRILALDVIALTNINKVRSLSAQERILEVIINEASKRVIFNVESVRLRGVDKANVRSSLGNLPSISRRRAATTTTSRSCYRASTDLVGFTVKDPIVSKSSAKIPHEPVSSIISISSVVGKILNTIAALSRASRPVRPRRELAVLLKTFELVGTLDARGNRGARRADADFIERSLDERDTTDILKVRSTAQLIVELNLSGVPDTLNFKRILTIVGELGVETTVVGALHRTTVTSLDRDVAENSDVRGHVPEVTAIIRMSAHGPVAPVRNFSGSGVDIRIRPLLINSSLATVEDVAVVISATSCTSA